MTISASASRRTTSSAPIWTEWPLSNLGLVGGSPMWMWEETAQPAVLYLRELHHGINVAWYAEIGWSR